ncbi:MAG TPA: hypothetical protein VII58_14065, partial [Acidobacteriaceae bacterium]
MLFKRTAAATALLAALVILTPATKASNVHRPELRHRTPAPPEPQEYRLRMHHLHTGEEIDIVYRIGDEYIPAALDRL